jgi:hypothetical protein
MTNPNPFSRRGLAASPARRTAFFTHHEHRTGKKINIEIQNLIDRTSVESAPMNRFHRWLFNGLTVLLWMLALCIATALLLSRSFGGTVTTKYLIFDFGSGSLFIEFDRWHKLWEIPGYLILWLAFVIPLPWVAIRYGSWKRSKMLAKRGLCPVCRYDLRATPDRCPECGTVPAKP